MTLGSNKLGRTCLGVVFLFLNGALPRAERGRWGPFVGLGEKDEERRDVKPYTYHVIQLRVFQLSQLY